MSRYPISCLDGSASAAFRTVLSFHRGDGQRVLDLTYGDGLSWGQPELADQEFELVRSDIKLPYAQDLFTCLEDRPDWRGAFDVVYYDPPWYKDIGGASDDPRAEAYGGYGTQVRSLGEYVAFVRDDVALLLRPGGKLIVKCGDQFHVKTRRLLLHHVVWLAAVAESLAVVDFYVYRSRRISPTAYQVKDRPCSVIMHSYFIVGAKP